MSVEWYILTREREREIYVCACICTNMCWAVTVTRKLQENSSRNIFLNTEGKSGHPPTGADGEENSRRSPTMECSSEKYVFVNLDHFPNFRDENEKCLKLPPTLCIPGTHLSSIS